MMKMVGSVSSYKILRGIILETALLSAFTSTRHSLELVQQLAERLFDSWIWLITLTMFSWYDTKTKLTIFVFICVRIQKVIKKKDFLKKTLQN